MIDFTEKELLALRAVHYGCANNSRLICSSYVMHPTDPEKRTEIEFSKAQEIVQEIIEKETEKLNSKKNIITCCECEYGETWYSGYYCKKMDTLTDNRATDFCSRAKKKEIKKGKEKDRQ